jgi:hypothetical protein
MSAITKNRGAVRVGRPKLGKFALRTGGKPIRTVGTLHGASRAWVYVGQARSGAIKIGMSGDPERRCRGLHVRLIHAVEVTPSAAKDVETEALQNLGRRMGEGEWVQVCAEDGIAAVSAAFASVGRSRHVDPALSEDEARQHRIILATCGRGAYELAR